MKKDIEWLKKEFDEVVEFRKQSNPSSSWGMGSNAVLKYIKEDFKNLINELDEPEVLSQEWIEGNTTPVDDEGRLYIWKRDLENLIIPKQELPVIPKYVADWIKDKKPFNSLWSAFIHITKRREKDYDDTLALWVAGGNSETFARAWLDGYEVEETKYNVRVPHAEGDAYYYRLNNGELFLSRWTEGERLRDGFFIFTEQEIKELLPDISKKYWEEIK